MRIKYFLISLIGLAYALTASAQTNLGVDYMALGEKELAKSYFMKRMRQAPAEAYYYLGQIAYEEGKMEEAKKNFQSGLNGNPESLFCQIGLAKLNYKSDPKQTEKDLDEIRKKNKRDIPILIEVARACTEIGYTKGTEEALKEARKANMSSPLIYLFQGQVLEKAGEVGKAAQEYDQAKNFDPNFVLSYVKGAQVYRWINPEMAVELLNTAVEKDPKYTIAYKYLADINYSRGAYNAAIAAYEKLIASGFYTDEDLIGYAASQYFTGRYDDAKGTIETGLAKNPKDFVLNRLKMYSMNELQDYVNGGKAGKTFFSIPRHDTAKYLVQDHMTYANILSETGDKEGAINQYRKVIELEPEAIELRKEVALLCANEGLYEQAGDFYVDYIEKKTDETDPTDYFQSGNYYYRAGALALGDSLIANKGPAILAKADKQFAKLIEINPELPLGHLMRARVNAQLDPETTKGLALPYYQSLLAVTEGKYQENPAEANETVVDNLKEAYSYLSYYYYLQFTENVAGSKAKAKDAVDKLLGIDPGNNVGLQLKPVLE